MHCGAAAWDWISQAGRVGAAGTEETEEKEKTAAPVLSQALMHSTTLSRGSQAWRNAHGEKSCRAEWALSMWTASSLTHTSHARKQSQVCTVKHRITLMARLRPCSFFHGVVQNEEGCTDRKNNKCFSLPLSLLLEDSIAIRSESWIRRQLCPSYTPRVSSSYSARKTFALALLFSSVQEAPKLLLYRVFIMAVDWRGKTRRSVLFKGSAVKEKLGCC